MGVNSLPKTVTRQRRGFDLNSGPSAPESSTLTTRLLSHPATAMSNMHKILVRIGRVVLCQWRLAIRQTDRQTDTLITLLVGGVA